MKLFLAAPESGLPSALTALVAQVLAMHFFMKEVLAAPASGLPSFPIALLSQLSCAKAAPPAKATTKTASIIFLSMAFLPSKMVQVIRFDPRRLVSARGNTHSSIDLRHETLRRLPGPLVAGIRLARRKLDLDRPHVLIGDLVQEMPDTIEAGALLVIGIDDVPRDFLAIGMREHHVL